MGTERTHEARQILECLKKIYRVRGASRSVSECAKPVESAGNGVTVTRRESLVYPDAKTCLSVSITVMKPPVGEPDAGKPPARFGGRGEGNFFPIPIYYRYLFILNFLDEDQSIMASQKHHNAVGLSSLAYNQAVIPLNTAEKCFLRLSQSASIVHLLEIAGNIRLDIFPIGWIELDNSLFLIYCFLSPSKGK